jgi:hypothetical protein
MAIGNSELPIILPIRAIQNQFLSGLPIELNADLEGYTAGYFGNLHQLVALALPVFRRYSGVNN